MKQHIDYDQAREIFPQMECYLPTIGLATKGYNGLMEWLTIGHMIEILTKRKAFVHFTVWDSKSDTRGVNYQKIAIVDGIGEDCINEQYDSEELCDALFMAVKEVLK
jgi:hypothetical protein